MIMNLLAQSQYSPDCWRFYLHPAPSLSCCRAPARAPNERRSDLLSLESAFPATPASDMVKRQYPVPDKVIEYSLKRCPRRLFWNAKITSLNHDHGLPSMMPAQSRTNPKTKLKVGPTRRQPVSQDTVKRSVQWGTVG